VKKRVTRDWGYFDWQNLSPAEVRPLSLGAGQISGIIDSGRCACLKAKLKKCMLLPGPVEVKTIIQTSAREEKHETRPSQRRKIWIKLQVKPGKLEEAAKERMSGRGTDWLKNGDPLPRLFIGAITALFLNLKKEKSNLLFYL
jgi:hypothetical protein